jgi:maltose O-acetyltransferase
MVTCHDQGVEAGERTMRERMLAGEPYRFDESLAADTRRCRVLLERINAATPDQDDERDAWLGELLGAFGPGSNVRPPFRCEYGYQIHVGAGVFANFGLVCLDVARITIGDDTQIGPGVQLLTPTHPLEPGPRREGWESAEPITIGANVWLGGAVVVCPGVTIGDDTVVGAGAVVVRDLPAGVLAVGNPARVVRSLAESSRDDSA